MSIYKRTKLPVLDGNFDLNKNQAKIIKWIEFFHKKSYVKKISAPKKIMTENKAKFIKLISREYNGKYDFFEENRIYLVIELEIRQVKLIIYFYANDTVIVGYKVKTTVEYIKEYVYKHFAAKPIKGEKDKLARKDVEHNGWEKTWKKIQKIETLTNLGKETLTKILSLIF